MKKLVLAALAALVLLCAGHCAAARADPASIPYPARLSIYYQCLDSRQKAVFDKVYDALYMGDGGIAVPEVCTRDEVRILVNQLFNECAELCAFDPDRSTYRVGSSGKVNYVTFAYKRTIDEQFSFMNSVAASARRMHSVKDVIDHVSARFTYDYTSTDNGKYYAYEAMQRGRGVCNAYAQTVAMFCHFAGLECSYIDGTSSEGGGHAWNIVRIAGRYTLIDVTWADVNDAFLNYQWLGLSTREMNESHTPYGDRYTIPACVNAQEQLLGVTGGARQMNYEAAGFMLRGGDRGAEVRALQQRLIALGYLRDRADGVYGGKTKTAVAAFQRNNGIHGVDGTSGVASRLTQSALYSDFAVPANGPARVNAWTWTGSKTPFSIWVGEISITGSGGRLTFSIRNDNPQQPIVSLALRYWADAANGSLTVPMVDYSLWNIRVMPGETKTFSIDFLQDAGLRRAALVKWNVLEVEFGNGEIFISENLSGKTGYYIRTYNQNVTPR